MADGHEHGGPSAPHEAEQEQPTMPLPALRSVAWRQRMAALLPTQRLPAVVSRSPVTTRHRPSPQLARWALVTALAVLVLAGAGGALYKVSHAAEDAATAFCADVAAGHYDAAYGLLGASLQAQVTRNEFDRIGPALDTVDGRVTTCTATSYDYALGSSQAALGARIVRAGGQSFSGRLALADEQGWKVASLGPSLTGASLGALAVALRFCDALRAGDGSALLALSSGDASAGLGDAQQLSTTLNTWQQVDGPVTGCTLVGTSGGAGASDTAAQITLGVTRARRGAAVAALGLTRMGQGWRVTTIGANLLGSDLGPLALGQRFCAALASGNYAGAYALFSPTYAAQVTLDQFTAAFAPLGGTWACAPQLTTYAVSGASGSYDVALTLTGAGQPLALTATLRFALADGAWAIQDVEPQGQ